ncbi:EAL domain-containing protein [Altericista sp. CCNU0014]|uniref:EAL domain-containing protein n=1 Tax=Altericista sp. CCNU0014 TaxID=3082949 RepID=UPI00384AA7D6
MTHRNLAQNKPQKRHHVFAIYRKPIFLIIFISVLPTVILLIISYFQETAAAKADLEGMVGIATAETNALLEDAEARLRRSNIDLQAADNQTAANILKRQIYNDFRFREAGLINPEGLLAVSSLGVLDKPVPVSAIMSQFNPNNPELQILGPGRTKLMQENSILFVLQGSGRIGRTYLLVDPAIITYFLKLIPNQNSGPYGFIALVKNDRHLLSGIGAVPQDISTSLKDSSFDTIRYSQTTKDRNIKTVGGMNRRWALRYWLQKLLVAAPVTIAISGVLSYLFIRQLRQVNGLEYEVKRGIIEDEFEIHYQPIMDLDTRQCIGSEALLRWRHPQRGLLYPGLFIPIAEQTGLIVPMTERLLEKAIQDQATFGKRVPGFYTSVNLSPTQLNKGDVDRLIQILGSAKNCPEFRIAFEITENKLIEEQGEVVQDAIARLKQWGCRFAIDDFGTGYSNIAYLQKLDLDQLKLDQLFIKGLEHDNNMMQIVDSLIDLGNRLGLTLIAEGIETEAQYQYIRDRGVRYGQGWLFSVPLPFEEFEQFLRVSTELDFIQLRCITQ